MKSLDFADEFTLLNELKCRNFDAFSWLCKEYSEDLLILAYTILGDASLANEKVEKLFIVLWGNNKLGNITLPIHKYLSTELQNLCRSKVI